MTIVQIMENLGPTGGVNTFVYDLCLELRKQGQNVVLIGIIGEYSTKNPLLDEVRKAGIIVRELRLKDKKTAIFCGIALLRKTIKELVGDKVAICNLHLKTGVLLGCFSTIGLKNISVIETYHSQYSKYYLINKICSPFIRCYIPCSETAHEELVRRFHIKESKITTIPNGINVKQIMEGNVANQVNPVIEVVSVGRFTRQKNFQVTSKAFSDIKENFKYTIYGNGELKNDIINAAKMSKKIVIHESINREKVLEILRQCDLVVMPSLWEGLSIFMLEALACGAPIMISNVPSLRNVLCEGELMENERWRLCKWGYLIDTNDASAYRDALCHYMDNINDLKPIMKTNILSIAAQYDISITANNYINVYNKIAKVNG